MKQCTGRLESEDAANGMIYVPGAARGYIAEGLGFGLYGEIITRVISIRG
jgi:hypothetical protein